MERKPFRIFLRDALIERGIVTGGMGNPNWAEFAESLPDVHYETLRKAVAGDRAPAPVLMERVAQALGIDPSEFVEYELWLIQRQFDPKEVGLEQAEANLRLFVEARAKKRR